MFGHLQIEERGRPTRVVDIVRSATIGRTADNDIILDSDGVSHCHAMLLTQPGGVDLVDLGSTFGTFINNMPAEPDEPVRLIDGAEIMIGRAALHYLAPRITVALPPGALNMHAPRPLAKAHLNTRIEGLGPGQPLEVGRQVALLVWVGAPIPNDLYQSSRPLRLAREHLANQVALHVRVRAASLAWRVLAEQPTLLAASWGSAQIARHTLVAQRAERTRLTVRVEYGDEHALVQQLQLGLMAGDPRHAARGITRPQPIDDLPNQALPICRSCFAPLRAGARFCPACGARI